MKLLQSFTNKFVTCGVALVVATTAFNLTAQTAKQGLARVARVQGAARYSTGNNIWQPLHAGTVIKPGSVIQTASGSQVDIVFGDREAGVAQPVVGTMMYRPQVDVQQNVVRLRENTLLAIDKLTMAETGADVVTETQLDLRQGRIFGNVKKMPAASKYEVKIPNGVAGIRGTIYDISTTGVVSVFVGSVVIAYVGADGNVVTQVLVGGQQFDSSTGLISNIPDFDQKEAVKEAKAAGIGPNTPATTIATDQTIIYISPTTGFNGNRGTSGGG